MKTFLLIIFGLFLSTISLFSQKILTLNLAYKIDEVLFEVKNLTLENPKNEHLSLKISQTDSTFVVQIVPIIPMKLQKFNVHIQTNVYEKFLGNGFQSWSLTKWYTLNDKIKKVGFPFGKWVKPYGDYEFWYKIANHPKHPRSHYFTLIEKKERKRDFFISLNEEQAYTIFEFINSENIIIHKDVEGWEIHKPSEILSIYYKKSVELAEIQEFFQRQFTKSPEPPVLGWTSWYNYYTQINENIVLENLEGFYHNRLPIDFIQVDDGWQKEVGDWEPNGKFSLNLKDLTEDIHKRKFKAGLWIAPFIAEQNSFLFKERKDWLVTNPDNYKLVKVGFNPLWSGFFKPAFYALDIYNPEVQIYIRNVLKTIVKKWEFDLLKLDFLYAVATIPRNGKTRAMIMNDALKLLVTWKGNAKLLGCGVPLALAMNKMDYCRIGPDISLNWDTKWMRKLKNLERISTMNAIHNTINRAIFNDIAFGNDPDVSILRTQNTKLKPHQKLTLFYVNHLLGNLNFISDNPTEWTDSILSIYKIIFPHQPLKIVDFHENEDLYIVDFQDDYALWVNMNKKKHVLTVQDSIIYESIHSRILKKGDKITLKYGESILFKRVDTEQDIAFVGSTGYILPGREIEALASDFENHSISVSINPKMKINKIWLKIPQDWADCKINGEEAKILVINGVKIAVFEKSKFFKNNF